MVILKKSGRKRKLYKIAENGECNGYPQFRVSKLNGMLDVEGHYNIFQDFQGKIQCTCPSRKQPCKHIGMLHKFTEMGHLKDGTFLDEETGQFIGMDQLAD